MTLGNYMNTPSIQHTSLTVLYTNMSDLVNIDSYKVE